MTLDTMGLSVVLWTAAELAIALFLVWLVVRVARLAWDGTGRGGDAGPRGRGRDESLDILRARYASGEIDEAEFDKRTRFLGS